MSHPHLLICNKCPKKNTVKYLFHTVKCPTGSFLLWDPFSWRSYKYTEALNTNPIWVMYSSLDDAFPSWWKGVFHKDNRVSRFYMVTEQFDEHENSTVASSQPKGWVMGISRAVSEMIFSIIVIIQSWSWNRNTCWVVLTSCSLNGPQVNIRLLWHLVVAQCSIPYNVLFLYVIKLYSTLTT